MLYSFKQIQHELNKFQSYINYIFLHIWCRANGPFSISKFDGYPELREIVDEFYNSEEPDLIYGPVERIYEQFLSLDKDTKRYLKRKYIVNNRIEKLCKNLEGYEPIKYNEIATINVDLANEMKNFFVSLWTDIISHEFVKKRLKTVVDHFHKFRDTNGEVYCPYCGLNRLTSKMENGRDEYDHYLPKAKYPFNTVNFNNLAPMCDKCNNSTNKGQKDPIFYRNKRKKAFYSYSADNSEISVEISFLAFDKIRLVPEDVSIELHSTKYPDEVATWDYLFNIKKRYKAACIDEGYTWLENVMILNGYNNTDDLLESYRKLVEQQPWSSQNFLKYPYLKECKAQGIFELYNEIRSK